MKISHNVLGSKAKSKPRPKGLSSFAETVAHKKSSSPALFPKPSSSRPKLMINIAQEADAISPWWSAKLLLAAQASVTTEGQRPLAESDLQDILKAAGANDNYMRINLLHEFN